LLVKKARTTHCRHGKSGYKSAQAQLGRLQIKQGRKQYGARSVILEGQVEKFYSKLTRLAQEVRDDRAKAVIEEAC
jgi:hypothetical protein